MNELTFTANEIKRLFQISRQHPNCTLSVASVPTILTVMLNVRVLNDHQQMVHTEDITDYDAV